MHVWETQAYREGQGQMVAAVGIEDGGKHGRGWLVR